MEQPAKPPRGPLAGVRIIDMTSVILGPFATQCLAELGAEVIKIEAPEGDNTRHTSPARHPGMGHIFLNANRGKKSVVLDLKRPGARDALLRLLAGADVFINNTRAAAMQRLQLDWGALAPTFAQLIYVQCCGFDPRGPKAGKPAYDDLIQGAVAFPWLMEHSSSSPQPAYVPISLCDRVTALYAVQAVTAALYAREKTGRGQCVHVPMFEAMTQFVLGDHLSGLTFDPPLGGPGYTRIMSPHRRPFRTLDGHLCVLIYNDRQWRSFFAAIGQEERMGEAIFATHSQRMLHIDAVYAEVARLMRQRSTGAWQQLLDAADIPNMPLATPETLLADPQHQTTGFIARSEHPSEGTLLATGCPTLWSETPPARALAPAPRLGEHTLEVLRAAGLTEGELAALQKSGACVPGGVEGAEGAE